MKHERSCLLAGDIGGTKVNLGLFRADSGGLHPIAEMTYESRSAGGLEELAADLLDRHPVELAAACFGVAGPVSGGAGRLTNLGWQLSEAALRQRFGWPRVRLINDLEATALAVPWLGPADCSLLKPGAADGQGNIALAAPGTGFGQALLIRENDRYLPVASEGGHVDFAPADEAEIGLWRFLKRRYGGHVSVERVLSGQGLVDIHEWLRRERPARKDEAAPIPGAQGPAGDPAAHITRLALSGEAGPCRDALLRFCGILGAVAGNLALTGLATGGVYIGGGIAPKIFPILAASDFPERFTAKGRFSEFLSAIPVWVIQNDKAALMGAARAALTL